MAAFDSELLQASHEGNLELVSKLVEKNAANVNCQGQMNRTPLHLAALTGKLEVCMYLIEKGSKLDVQASSGETPILLATINNHTNIVEFLLEQGANWKLANHQGKQPKDYARKKQMKKLYEDAEKGIFTHEEDNSEVPMKKRKFSPDETVMQELLNAGLGYTRPEILDAFYALNEKRDELTLANTMKFLEQAKKDKQQNDDNNNNNNESNKKDNKDDDDNTCKICFESTMDCVILNCGHVCACYSCAESLKNCPMCRNQVHKVVKIFKS